MFYKNKWYLAAYRNQVYRVHSWVTVKGFYEIPQSNLRYYNADGSIAEKYAKSPVYLKLSGISVKPR